MRVDESSSETSKEYPGQEGAFRELLQLLIYDWIQTEIPSWKPDRSPKYQRGSQALTAPIPEGENTARGLVYFKNVFDPYWSDEDLARLHGMAYPWMLMILSPCERFYEFENRLRELAAQSRLLMIWRPDSPSAAELDHLHKLALEGMAGAPEAEPWAGEGKWEACQILTSLYVGRGYLINASDIYVISDELGGRSICQYVSTRLAALPLQGAAPAGRAERLLDEAADKSRAFRWAALLLNRPQLQDARPEDIQEQLIEWWTNSVAAFSKNTPDFPETFMTIRFRNEVKYVENHLRAVKTAIHGLRSGKYSLVEAVGQLERHFAADEGRLSKWKQSLENLARLTRWLPAFLHAQDYVCSAFPLGLEQVDRLRECLLVYINEPCRFLEPKERADFDQMFLEFKKTYIESYCSIHEEVLQSVSGSKTEESRIDPVSLRNLELLSGLQHTDKSYLNRVNVLARWVQRNRCDLPLRQILERYPRCYCNFNPFCNQQPADSAARIKDIIREGTEYFRAMLRLFERLITEELKAQQIDNYHSKQITALLSHDPMIPLKPHTIEILNGIIGMYSNEFLAEIRNYAKINRPLP